MKTLKDHTILYDGECPMCNLYTKAFVTSGMLDQQGRKKYQQMPEAFRCSVDHKRAMDEIALVNSKTGEVSYGIQSLFKIISHAFPVFKPLFSLRPFAWLMDKFYKFISYNRRVIMPSKHADPGLEPSFNRSYRLLYIISSLILTAFILNSYGSQMGFLPATNMTRELAICGGQIIWQLGILRLMGISKGWDYTGNLLTISLAGGIVLAIIQGLLYLSAPVSDLVYGGLFLLVVALMLIEHIRRSSILGLSWILSAGWVAYRIIILLIIINL